MGRYDRLHALPGLVYRRDSIDRTHVGAPHQVDLWRLKARGLLGAADLDQMMAAVVEAVLPAALHPDVEWRATPATHSYTDTGRQLDVLVTQPDGSREWLELAECGLVAAQVLRGSGLDPRRWAGLAMGLGLDRALMLRKGIRDIRLLRSENPDIQAQLLDLRPYRPVSVMPEVRRDLSLVLGSAAEADVELLGDRARTALGAEAERAGRTGDQGRHPGVGASARRRRTAPARSGPGECAAAAGAAAARPDADRRARPTSCATACTLPCTGAGCWSSSAGRARVRARRRSGGRRQQR